MESKKTIGKLIEYEVRKQEIEITEFAKKIKCKRNNVYDIFKRNNLDVELLARISEVLNHNFFIDVAKDYSLADTEEESEEEKYNSKAVNQFMDVVPKVLKDLGKETSIMFSDKDEFGLIIPDFVLPSYGITFTIGSTWAEKTNVFSNPIFAIQLIENDENSSFFLVVDKRNGSPMVDIKLDYKSYDEWKEMLSFVFQKLPNLNFRRYGSRL